MKVLKPKLALIWYWSMASQIFDGWRDGLRAAIELLSQDYTVDFFLDKDFPYSEDNYDVILLWADSNCEFITMLPQYRAKKGLLYGSTFKPSLKNLEFFDVVYVENDPMLDHIRGAGINAIKAFGTDSNFFAPDSKQDKKIEYFYPATFSPWKNQKEIAFLGSELTCVGYVQPDGKNELEECLKHQVNVIPRNLTALEVKGFYQQTRNVVIPAKFGSERTVLESMSMNIVPRVWPENENAFSFVKEFYASPYITPRDFIVANYSARIYADQILKGLNE